jgi:hypothetical protein
MLPIYNGLGLGVIPTKLLVRGFATSTSKGPKPPPRSVRNGPTTDPISVVCAMVREDGKKYDPKYSDERYTNDYCLRLINERYGGPKNILRLIETYGQDDQVAIGYAGLFSISIEEWLDRFAKDPFAVVQKIAFEFYGSIPVEELTRKDRIDSEAIPAVLKRSYFTHFGYSIESLYRWDSFKNSTEVVDCLLAVTTADELNKLKEAELSHQEAAIVKLVKVSFSSLRYILNFSLEIIYELIPGFLLFVSISFCCIYMLDLLGIEILRYEGLPKGANQMFYTDLIVDAYPVLFVTVSISVAGVFKYIFGSKVSLFSDSKISLLRRILFSVFIVPILLSVLNSLFCCVTALAFFLSVL